MLARGFFTLMLVVSLALLGCDDPAGASAGAEVGRYELQTVNGAALPAHLPIAGGVLTFTAGFVDLKSDETFTASLTATFSTGAPPAQPQTYARGGDYTRDGDRIRFEYLDGPADVATLDGDRLTVSSEGRVFVFQR